MNKIKVFINGGEGTTGLRILECFEGRDDIELIPIASELRKDPAEVKKKINESDITFLCLPDAASIEAVSYIENPNVRIIDASTAHRTNPDWSYGFPELSAAHREGIKNSKRVAVPGCYASGFNGIVYPMMQAGLITADALITCAAITGYSGAGKKAIAQYQDTDTRAIGKTTGDAHDPLCSPRQYALAQQHKHLKEMKAIPGLTHEPIFLPQVCDYYSGMIVSIPFHADALVKKVTLAELHEVFAKHYESQKFVKVLALDDEQITGNFLSANTITGYDGMEVLIYGNDDRMVVSTRFDNLGKGASGAAVQCMNLMIGAEEDKGLNL